MTRLCPLLRRMLLALVLLAMVVQPAATLPAAAGPLGVDRDTLAAAAKAPPVFDRSLMLLGCTAGLALGTLSTVLPPVAAWSIAGVWMGGLATMVVRAGFGCGYGALGGAVASAARSTLIWITATWRHWTGRPVQRPLPIEGTSGS